MNDQLAPRRRTPNAAANVKRHRERHDLVPVTVWWPRELVEQLDAALATFNVSRTKGLRTMVERRLRELASAAAIPKQG